MYFTCTFLSAFLLLLSSVCKGDYNNLSELYVQAKELLDGLTSYTPLDNNNAYFVGLDDDSEPLDYGSYDFVIVGGGTAGGVVANRLTEEKFSVLLIEAGPEDSDVTAVLGLASNLIYSKWNWGYKTVPQNKSCQGAVNQECNFARGKVLGGTSSINGGYYVRGSPKDFDIWADLGNEGWSYNDILPYFKKSEYANFSDTIDLDYHGFKGLQSVGRAEDTPSLTTNLLNGFKEIGLTEQDYNGQQQQGYSRVQYYLSHNVRAGTNFSYIRHARNRSNLDVILNSLATKIVIKNKRAVGIEFVHSGKKYYTKASKEIIVACGTANTPQLLMLSGIGPAEELNKHNIEVIVDLPVGKNLQDHVFYDGVIVRTNQSFYNYTLLDQLKLWEKNKRPLNAGFEGQVIAFWDYDDDEVSDIMLVTIAANNMTGKIMNLFDEKHSRNFLNVNAYSDFIMLVILLHPVSVGHITLASNDPRDYPVINGNYFADSRDIDNLYKGIEFALKLNDTLGYQNISAQVDLIPVPECDIKFEKNSRDWIYCVLPIYANGFFHPVGTASMGISPENSVVDRNLKVHGLDNLRIVDASVMPNVTSGPTNAPVVMIAEKASDMIKSTYINHIQMVNQP